MKIRLLLAAGLTGLVLFSGCSRSDAPAGTATTATADDRAAPPAADLAQGRAVFDRVCAVCHQQTGAGVPGVFPPLLGSEILTAADPGRPIRIVLHGLHGPVQVGGKTYDSVMPAQGAQLNDAEIAAALSYARGAWGNQAPAVSADSVRTVRATVQRETFWTWEELVRATPAP